LRVSWRLRTPASMISGAKTASLKNYRRTGRGSRGRPRVRFLGEDTVRARSDHTLVGVMRGGYFRLSHMAQPHNSLVERGGMLPGSLKADTPENPSSPSPYLYIGIGMVMIGGKGAPSYTRMIGVPCGPSGTAGEARIRTYPDNRVHLGECDLYKRGHHLR
jgi:hypothetical protein